VAEPLRVIDFGVSSPLRSQTLWHAVAYGVSAGAPATLSFVRPAAPYVCLGYHRNMDEVDTDYCRANGLPVFRRMVGGGPVYLDSNQLFFQICVRVESLPPGRHQAMRTLLEPAVAAFRALGVPAALDAGGEICVEGKKICGHGAGQIEDAVIVCGNLIEQFDHERAARVLAMAEATQREETLALMRRFVGSTPVDPGAFRSTMTASYRDALSLGGREEEGALTGLEHEALVELDERFTSRPWLDGPRPPSVGSVAPRVRQVKVRAGVCTFAVEGHGALVTAGVVDGVLERVHLFDGALNGSRQRAEHALVGVPVNDAARVLSGFGDPGRRLAALLASLEPARL
jgi:lipoate-protein ligase A